MNDRFIDGKRNALNDWVINALDGRLPVESSFNALWSYGLSEIPDAGGHSLYTANLVKADVLFKLLKKENKIPLKTE